MEKLELPVLCFMTSGIGIVNLSDPSPRIAIPRGILVPKLIFSCLLIGLSLLPDSRIYAQNWMRDSIQESTLLSGDSGNTQNSGGNEESFTGTFAVRTGLMYSDNVKLEREGSSGFAWVLGGNLGFQMPLTVNNELYLQVALNRHIYFSGQKGQQDFQTISPGSNLGLDVYVGRAKIRTFLNMSLQEDPVQAVVVNETDRFGRFNLDGGVQLDWNMNKVVLQAMTLVGRQWHTAGDGSLDAWRYANNLRFFFPKGASGGVGLSIGRSEIDYLKVIQNDTETMSYGIFAHQMLSKNSRISGRFGYQDSSFSNSGTISDTENYSGFYGSLIFDHQVRKSVRYSLMFSHDISDGIGTNFYQISSVRFTPQLTIWKDSFLDVTIGHDWIDESGTFGESATRWNASARVKRSLGSHLSGTLEWQFLDKSSDIFSRTYARNMITALVEYTP